jgi:hypothetical protein
VGTSFERRPKITSPTPRLIYFGSLLGGGAEVGVVVFLSGWTQGKESSQRWKPGWGLGVVPFTVSPPTGENSEVETLKREEMIFNKLRGRMIFYFTDKEVTYNICKKVYSKILSIHLLVQRLKALELALGCRLEVIHVPGTTVITQGTDVLSRGIWANGFSTYFKSFAVEVFLPALPSLYLTHWALSRIGIQAEHAA